MPDYSFDANNSEVVALMPLAATSITIPDQDLDPGSIYKYARVAFSDCGKWNFAQVTATVIIDDAGDALAKAPNPPLQLTATVLAGGTVQLQWYYSSIDQAVNPTGFYIYIDSGSGFDFDNPDDTVTAPASLARAGMGGEFTWTSDTLSHGVTHKFCVRSYNASYGQSQNTNFVSAVPDSVGPDAATGITGTWEEI
jgi:hypothetical protein